MKRRGIFITFEGTEGSGKTTQIKLLVRYLRRRGVQVVATHEPGGTAAGTRIRRMLLDKSSRLSPESETLLYMASRAELVRSVILPALQAGKTVISDRWVDATYAYQGCGLGVDRDWIRSIAQGALAGLEPKISFYLDIPVDRGLDRALARGRLDRIESRSLSFHRRVRAGYLDLVHEHRRFRRIPPGEILKTHERIRRIVDAAL